MTDTNPASPAGHDEILEADARRYRALIAADADAAGELLHEDLLYVHSSGVVDTKTSYLAALGSGTRYRAAHLGESTVRRYGDVAMIHGTVTLEAEVGGVPRVLPIDFVNVWVLGSGGWQMVHWQSTLIPAPAATA
jgi:hypothetical protein